MASTATHAANTEYLVRKAMSTGYQLFSLLTPPAYTAFILASRGRSAFTVNRLLRATWLGGFVGGLGCGGLAYVRYAYSSEEIVRSRRIRTAYDTDRIRADDHAVIGSILFAVFTPALLWKRAQVVHLILGGAGIGSSIGILTHYTRTISGDPPPKAEIPNIPVKS